MKKSMVLQKTMMNLFVLAKYMTIHLNYHHHANNPLGELNHTSLPCSCVGVYIKA